MGRSALLLLLLLLSTCQGPSPADWAKVSRGNGAAGEPHLPDLLSDAQLKTFLPERLGERVGELPQGTMTRMGDRALSEATRSYRPAAVPPVAVLPAAAALVNQGQATRAPSAPFGTQLAPGPGPQPTGQVDLKIADARLEPRAAQAIRTLAADDPDALPAERLVLPGAIGYARYDEGDRVAQAQVLIAGRFIASATVAEADGPQEAAQALRAVDTLALARLAQIAQ